jgi:hypothetical protein
MPKIGAADVKCIARKDDNIIIQAQLESQELVTTLYESDERTVEPDVHAHPSPRLGVNGSGAIHSNNDADLSPMVAI